jgi:hypothetical protein
MAKNKSTTPRKQASKKPTELIAIEIPLELVNGMKTVGIINQEEYITFLIASSLLNYQKIFKDEQTEKQIKKIKSDSDHENYLR